MAANLLFHLLTAFLLVSMSCGFLAQIGSHGSGKKETKKFESVLSDIDDFNDANSINDVESKELDTNTFCKYAMNMCIAKPSKKNVGGELFRLLREKSNNF